MQEKRSLRCTATGAGDEDPRADGAILPRHLLSTRLRGRTAEPPQAGGVGVAELASRTIFAATSTPLAMADTNICLDAVGVADVCSAPSSATTPTPPLASAALPKEEERNVDVTEIPLATGSAITPTLREELVDHLASGKSHSGNVMEQGME